MSSLRPAGTVAQEDAPTYASYQGWRVESLRFEGNETLDDDFLQDVVYTQASSGFLFWAKKEQFDAAQFDRDVLRLRAAYRREGFDTAQADGEVTANDSKRTLKILFTIVEGPPTMVASITLDGWPEHVLRPEDWEEPLPLQVGKRWGEGMVHDSAEALADTLRLRGHYRVSVEGRSERLERRADVTFHVEPGPIVWLRNLSAEGRGDVPQWMVDESILVEPGAPFVEAELAASRSALSRRRVFRRVGTEIIEVAVDTVDVEIRLEPGGQRSRAIGAGYGSEEKFRLRGSWVDRNFYGGGRTLNLEARFSSIKRELDARFTQPRFPTESVTFETGLRPGFQIEDTYDLRGGELDFFFRRRLTEHTSFGAGTFFAMYTITKKTEDDPDFDSNLDRGAELQAVFLRRTSDDLLAATRGSVLVIKGALADQDVLGSATYGAAELDYRWYREVGEAHVLAVRHQVGTTLPGHPSPTLPVWRRRYGGGSNDMRSYRRRSLGPVDSNGNGLGGELLAISVLELRLYHTRTLGLALFGEMGQVWRKFSDARIDGLRFGLGWGLRLNTPIGPIRLDLGVKAGAYDPVLKPRVWHFSIGEAF